MAQHVKDLMAAAERVSDDIAGAETPGLYRRTTDALLELREAVQDDFGDVPSIQRKRRTCEHNKA